MNTIHASTTKISKFLDKLIRPLFDRYASETTILDGAMGSAFTLTLANIFMWKWQKQIILSKIPSHELYGRLVSSSIFIKFNENFFIIDILMISSLLGMNLKKKLKQS